MAHPDSLFDLFKPVLWLVAATFLIGFTGVLTLAGPGIRDAGEGQSELAAAMDAAGPGIQDS